MINFFSKKGAGQTEYIIIVVLVAVSSIFAVAKYGEEIKSLFKKTNIKLTLFNGNDSNSEGELNPPSEDDNNQASGGLDETGGGSETVGDSVSNNGENNRNEDRKSREECRREYGDLMRQKQREETSFRQKMARLNQMERVYRTNASYYFRLGSGGWWWGFWRHRSRVRNRYIEKGRMYLRLANRVAEQKRQETERHNAFLENWNLKMEQWREQCGNSP